ncbi:MAG: 4-hydroxy-tetrahydrodipicolinate synthase [Oscillospiraceae bacterium]|jgi:4-hydroxy-tetrahydrodipicolinate synthase|uniref:4-hydroxy-tetrahydrodipicolinate synthase n=1 Tax=Porcipelethomonas sp. TaxID=2981675 RepID=UPI0009663A59|nr:4-hydroxy-tetrahydrodipicolinate synthase [Oscillospiraceae bacterium]MBS6315078.1 4-hydroxy-tetrahydrodipicolinate synthase [Ruminococcus sp.]OLA68691.1 MAG: 4-hydroxy-tetrahydrodipicolinate synthase [Ruminococcus sp. 37_24]
MKNTIFTGAGVAIITPMNADGSINYDGFAENIEFQIANGTDAIIVCGTTGEASTMTDDEHIECIRFAVEKTAGRIPVIAGTGSNDTKYAVELSKIAQEKGADGLLLVTPYYNKASQKGLVAHFTAIADAVDIPIILYNIPGRTGVSIDMNTYKILGQHKNIVAVKEASGNISYTSKLIAQCGDLLDVYSGNDDIIVPMMSIGAKGVISVISNIMPKETHEITQLCLANNCEEAAKLQMKYLELINNLFIEVNPIPIKEAMNQMKMPSGPCRLPLCEMTDEHIETLKNSMKKIGLI